TVGVAAVGQAHHAAGLAVADAECDFVWIVCHGAPLRWVAGCGRAEGLYRRVTDGFYRIVTPPATRPRRSAPWAGRPGPPRAPTSHRGRACTGTRGLLSIRSGPRATPSAGPSLSTPCGPRPGPP